MICKCLQILGIYNKRQGLLTVWSKRKMREMQRKSRNSLGDGSPFLGWWWVPSFGWWFPLFRWWIWNQRIWVSDPTVFNHFVCKSHTAHYLLCWSLLSVPIAETGCLSPSGPTFSLFLLTCSASAWTPRSLPVKTLARVGSASDLEWRYINTRLEITIAIAIYSVIIPIILLVVYVVLMFNF